MPLSGVRVLDLSRLAPGPYATRLLAEMGAEVIKIESPAGDNTRYTPPRAGDPPTGGVFSELNAGKMSVVLDLRDPRSVEALRRLSADSDVLVDGFRPGTLKAMGLDPSELRIANPRLVYCAITGYGLTGPDARRAGHDVGYLARGGVLAMAGGAALGVQIADIGASFVAVAGIAAALFARARTGEGGVVDVSLAESGLAFNALNFGTAHAGGTPRFGREILDGSRPCYSVYATKDDKRLAVGTLEPKFWKMFLDAIGLPELVPNQLDLDGVAKAKVQARLRERTRDEWAAVFREVDCCVEPVLECEEAEMDPQHVSREVFAPGFARSPIRVGLTRTLAPPPRLGEHTREVLARVGMQNLVDDAEGPL